MTGPLSGHVWRAAGADGVEVIGDRGDVVVLSADEHWPLVGRRRGGEPGPYGPVKPRLLLIRVVDRHERPETVRADIAGDDQEIARRNVGQEPVLIAERNDSHAVISTPVSHRLVTAAIGPGTSREALP